MSTRERVSRVLFSALATLGLTLANASCLVTEKVDYPVTNSPPTITRMTPSVYARIESEPPAACTRGTASNFLAVQLDVRDEDLEDAIEGLILVNNKLVAAAGFTVPTNGKPDRDQFTLCVPADALTFSEPCNLLEVRISRDFAGGANLDQPSDPQDLARRQLLVLASVADRPDASSEDCDGVLMENDERSGSAP